MGLLSDTHCHLNLDNFEQDRELILSRARVHGVERILVPGIDLPTSRAAVRLAETYTEVYAAVGVHPTDALVWDADTLSSLRDLARHTKTVAIGEIGLDYYRDRAPRDIQREIFSTQLGLAAEVGLPVVIHNRQAWDDLWPLLRDWQAELIRMDSPLAERPGVLHSFDGTLEQAQTAAEHGFLIGISGPVTYKNARERQQVAEMLALEQVIIETDAPYLPPHPYRGQRNEPAYVLLVAEKLATLHQKPLETIIRITWENAARLFAWGAIF